METKRLVLRPWSESDTESLYKFARDPYIGATAGWLPHQSKADSLRVLREILMKPDQYAIEDKASGKLVGAIGLTSPRMNCITGLNDGDFTIGFWIGRELWNRGYATEAAQAFMQMLFNEYGAKKIWASSFEGNIRSECVQEKLGMKYKFSEFIVHPVLHDAYMINVRCITKEEYDNRNEK